MAEKLTKWEKFDKLRMEEAVQEIADSTNLRFLFSQLFEFCGTQQTPFELDALQTARLCGRQELGFEIRDLLNLNCPNLSQTIEMEKNDELFERARNEDPGVGATRRGNSTSDSSGDATYE